jgi:predicted AlkP superfamily phosphohydrolase/phosphomutase
MFWRDRPDIIEGWYIKLDDLVGRVVDALQTLGLDKTRLLVVSDHGFSNFDQKVHLNRWMIDKSFLNATGSKQAGKLKDVDWQTSQAYALGLNSIYINQQGREGQGIVHERDTEQLAKQLKDELMTWRDAKGNQVVNSVMTNSEAFSSPLAEYGPDLIVGYAPGFRASQKTGLGEWERSALEANQDHWGADHCIDPAAVPGVIFSNQGLGNLDKPSYLDFPMLAIGEEVQGGASEPPPSMSDEDQEMLEERLKSLGYL